MQDPHDANDPRMDGADEAAIEAAMHAATTGLPSLKPLARWRSLCRLDVPTPAGPVHGTGYLVQNGLILTAAHVVKTWDERTPMRVRFLGHDPMYRSLFPTDEGGETTFDCREVAWSGWELGLDAALLKLERVPAGFDAPPMTAWIPRSEAPWDSAGFFRAANPEGRANAPAAPFMGRAYGWIPMELSVKDPPVDVDDKESWKGASGAPIFHGDQLVAVFTGWRMGHHGTRLFGTPGFALLSNPEFAKLLGAAELNDEGWLRELEDSVTADLEASEEARRALVAELPLRPPDGAEALARFLIREVDVCDLALAIASADHDLREMDQALQDRGATDPDQLERQRLHVAVRILRRVFAHAIPPRVSAGLASRGVGDLLRVRRERDSGAPSVGLPAQTNTVAAMLMAWLDKKPLAIRHVKAQRDVRGERQVGSDRFTFAKPDDFIRQLWIELCVQADTEVPATITTHDFSRPSTSGHLAPFQREVYGFLKNRARSGLAYYVVLTRPDVEHGTPSRRDLQEFYQGVVRIQDAFTEPGSKDDRTPRQHLRVVVLEGERTSWEYSDLVVPTRDLAKRWGLDDKSKAKETS